jgi:hypothetical protein
MHVSPQRSHSMPLEQDCTRTQDRHATKARALVTRENDAMRAVIYGHAADVSVTGLSLAVPVKMDVGESLLVELENPLQRFKVRCRARVQHVQPTEQGEYRVGCSVATRLSARDVQLLKSNQSDGW